MMMLPARSKTLPSMSLFSGRGSRRSLIRSISEKSMVKKIAACIRQEEEEVEDMADLESVFNSSQSSFALMSDGEKDGSIDSENGEDSEEFVGPSLSAVQHISPTDYASKQADEELWENTEDQKSATVIPCFHRKELDIDEDLLGFGSFSKVFAVKAIHLHNKDDQKDKKRATAERCRLAKKSRGNKGPSLVIKHLNRKLLRKPKEFKAAAMDLEREAKILTLARHSNIVRLRGMSLGGGSATAALADSGKYNDFFLILDRLTDTLDKRILRWKGGPDTYPGVATVATYSQQLASALAYLHDHRLIFRDVKPNNIGFISPTGNTNGKQDRLQLFDFGLCRSLPPRPNLRAHSEQKTFHMSLAGTTRYMAPEIMRQEGYNCKADVYSWAVTVWEMIEHQSKPYASIRPNHFLQCVSEMNVRPGMDGSQWDNVPEALKQLLRYAWCSSSKDRLSMASVFHHLASIIDNLNVRENHTCSSGSTSSSTSYSTKACEPQELNDSSMAWL